MNECSFSGMMRANVDSWQGILSKEVWMFFLRERFDLIYKET